MRGLSLRDGAMASIRIIAIPPGEAPQQVREAWVGVSLPVSRGILGYRRRWRSAGVLSGPRGLLDQLRWLVRGKYERREGCAVGTMVAADLLEKVNPEAARWWRENAAHLLQPGRHFPFPAQVCREEPSQ